MFRRIMLEARYTNRLYIMAPEMNQMLAFFLHFMTCFYSTDLGQRHTLLLNH